MSRIFRLTFVGEKATEEGRFGCSGFGRVPCTRTVTVRDASTDVRAPVRRPDFDRGRVSWREVSRVRTESDWSDVHSLSVYEVVGDRRLFVTPVFFCEVQTVLPGGVIPFIPPVGNTLHG